MQTARRGLVLGIGFGLAAAIVEVALAGVGTLDRRFGPGPELLLQTAGMLGVLGALLGLAVAPLLRLRGGRALAVAALALLWLGLGWLVAFEAPMGRLFLLAPVVGGTLLVVAGLGLARIAAWLPWAAGAGLLVAASFGPTAYLQATSPPPPPRAAQPPAPEGAPDVVVIVLDTVRARNSSAYGYARGTMPTLEALAREGALFVDATSPSTWSLPSHASLFTGRYPTGHGAHGEHLILDDRHPTLAQVLAARGWETACFTSNAWISDGLGLTRGFTFQDGTWRRSGGAGRNFSFAYRLLDRLGLVGGDKGGALVADRFARWIAERPAQARPAFVFLNFIEAHFPYHQLPGDYLHRFTDRPDRELEALSMALMGQQFGGPGRDPAVAGPPARDMYDGGVAYSDELLRRVVEALRRSGRLDDTVLVVLSDHGEVLGERAGFFGHGPSLHQESIGVPLLVRHPPVVPAGVRVETPVSTVGVFATVLDLAGVEAPPTLQVGSLVPLARGLRDEDAAGPVLSERMRMSELTGGTGEARLPRPYSGTERVRVYRSGPWKLMEVSGAEPRLYHLGEDPEETRDLAGERGADLARLRGELAAVRARLDLPALEDDPGAEGGAPDLDEATRERLRELGYVE